MTSDWDQDVLRARFCHALSEMYKTEVPLYGDLLDVVLEADTKVIQDSQSSGQGKIINPDDILPSRHRVERHGAIRLGTTYELSTIRRMFAVMGMYPVGYYDLSLAGFPMHATAFRPTTQDALTQHPFRVFTTVLRMELLTEKTRELAKKALSQRNIFTPRLLTLLDTFDRNGSLTPVEYTEFIANGLETFRWHSEATVTLDEYNILKDEHPLIADIVSFPNAHINHLTPRTIDIDLVQSLMLEHKMPAKDRIEGPPKRNCPILLRQTSFKALQETVYFDDDGTFVKGSHTARFGEVEQRGYALTRKGRQLYDQILSKVNDYSTSQKLNDDEYETLLEKSFESFPDNLPALREQNLAYFCYKLTSTGEQRVLDDEIDVSELDKAKESIEDLLDKGLLSFEPITYEDFLPLSAGGIFNSNLGDVSSSKQLIMSAEPDLDGFQHGLGTYIADEFHLYSEMQRESLEICRQKLGLKEIIMQ